MNTAVIPPGSVLGMLGDGQLGKMTAMAAAKLGYRIAVLGPVGRESPTGHVAYWAEAWGSGTMVSDEQLDRFCRLVSVVMLEWENVPVELVQRIEARGVPVRPGPKVLEVAQDRLLEKFCAHSVDIPSTPFWSIKTDSDLPGLVIPPRGAILKTRRNGYDGKGQVRLSPGESIATAWEKLGRVPAILEQMVDFQCEVSVIVARSSDEAVDPVTYGPFENVHEGGVLRTTLYPLVGLRSRFIRTIEDRAISATLRIAEALDVHGLLAVEFFVDQDGRVIFNEMAPRPHNSGHLTIECSDTSQFEQYVRAACNLPFGSVNFHRSGTMENILGKEVNGWGELVRQTGSPHLYGKSDDTDGRKYGHRTVPGRPLP